MKISLNGKTIDCSSATLMELVRKAGYEPASLVAEVNLEVIRQQDWESFVLNEGDAVELLSFVGGG